MLLHRVVWVVVKITDCHTKPSLFVFILVSMERPPLFLTVSMKPLKDFQRRCSFVCDRETRSLSSGSLKS